MLFSFLGVSVSFLQKHFCLNICYGNILLHFGLKAVKIHKVSKKCFFLPTSNRFAILNNPLMQLQIIFKNTLIKQSIEAAIQRCSENMQQIYRRTPMPKYDFNKVALHCNFIEIALRHGSSSVNLLHIFRTPFPRNTSGWLLLKVKVWEDFQQLRKLKLEWKGVGGKFALVLSLFLSIHISFQNKFNYHISLFIITFFLFSSIALLKFYHLQFHFNEYV